MSHKIKIDLCELFGVKEGQEFKVENFNMKYKIKNNILNVWLCGMWCVSTISFNELLSEDELIIKY